MGVWQRWVVVLSSWRCASCSQCGQQREERQRQGNGTGNLISTTQVLNACNHADAAVGATSIPETACCVHLESWNTFKSRCHSPYYLELVVFWSGCASICGDSICGSMITTSLFSLVSCSLKEDHLYRTCCFEVSVSQEQY